MVALCVFCRSGDLNISAATMGTGYNDYSLYKSRSIGILADFQTIRPKPRVLALELRDMPCDRFSPRRRAYANMEHAINELHLMTFGGAANMIDIRAFSLEMGADFFQRTNLHQTT
jgi:hypothetical protein